MHRITEEEFREFLLSVIAAAIGAYEDDETGVSSDYLYTRVSDKMSRELFEDGVALLERRSLIVRRGNLVCPGVLVLYWLNNDT